MTPQSLLGTAFVCAFLVPTTATAHHSYVEFDDKTTVEIEGTLVAAAWQNPHTHLTVKAIDGSNRSWDIETAPVNFLRRVDAPLELYEVGSRVKVAGWPSRRSAARYLRDQHFVRRRTGTDLVPLAAAMECDGNWHGTANADFG